jgi:hypothetical protein
VPTSAIASSELVLRYAKGDPVVVLATIFQHSPLTLFVRGDTGIQAVSDLAGRKVALAPWETEIFAYLQREQVPVDRLQIVQHEHSVNSLVEGRVDALAGTRPTKATISSNPAVSIASSSPAPRSGVGCSTATRCFSTRAIGGRAIRNGREAFHAPRACVDGSTRCRIPRRDRPADSREVAPDLPVDNLRFEAARMVSVRWCAQDLAFPWRSATTHVSALAAHLPMFTSSLGPWCPQGAGTVHPRPESINRRPSAGLLPVGS